MRQPGLGMVGLVAGREIRQRVRGRPFRVATGLLLLGVAAAVIIPVATRGQSTAAQRVGVVGSATPALRQVVEAAARASGNTVRIAVEPTAARADEALRAGRIDVAVFGAARVVVHEAGSRGDSLPRAMASLLGLARAVRNAGVSPAQAARISAARPVPVTSLAHGSTASSSGRSTATFAMVIIFILLTQYLTWTLMGVMEEKSSRVVEVLLAAVQARQLLSGKLLGIGAVVFVQAAVVAAFALVLGRAVGSDLLHGDAPLVLASAAVWVVLGYAFYSWLYAAAGSTVERQDQVQSLALPLSLPMLASYIIGISVAGTGHAPTWFHVLAYLPPTAPFAMTTLVGLGAATWWQFLISAALSVAATVAVARLAASVYRRAILRTGRRVPLRQLLRSRG